MPKIKVAIKEPKPIISPNASAIDKKRLLSTDFSTYLHKHTTFQKDSHRHKLLLSH